MSRLKLDRIIKAQVLENLIQTLEREHRILAQHETPTEHQRGYIKALKDMMLWIEKELPKETEYQQTQHPSRS